MREPSRVAGRLEERLQRGVERLTLFKAVRMVATVALSLAFVAAILELLVDSGINGFDNALWWAIVTVTTEAPLAEPVKTLPSALSAQVTASPPEV